MDPLSSHIKTLQSSPADLLLLLVVVFLPFSILITNIAIIALIVWCILTIRPSVWAARIQHHQRKLALMIAPFVFVVITLAYTNDFKAGLHEVEKSLALLLLPTVIVVSNFKKKSDFYTEAFAGLICIMCLVCMAAGLYRFFFHDLAMDPLVGDRFTAIASPWNALTNTNLTLPFKINPIYFSLYVTFAMAVILLSKNIGSLVKLTSFSLLLVFQILLGSRIGLAAMILAGMSSIFFTPARSRRYLLLGILACVFAVAVCLAVNPILRKRYSTELVAWKFPDKMEGWNAVSLRNAVWSCSLKVFKESPVFGKGVGGAAAGRQECYKGYSFYGYFGTDFNSHNQYLEYAVTGGIILAILFFLQLGISFQTALLRGDTVYFLFLVAFAIVAFGESLLEAHKGIIFFSCFNALFLFQESTVRVNV